jgi:hypothetical protein
MPEQTAEDKELAAAFDELGRHPEDCDVEYMIPVSREVFGLVSIHRDTGDEGDDVPLSEP